MQLVSNLFRKRLPDELQNPAARRATGLLKDICRFIVAELLCIPLKNVHEEIVSRKRHSIM